MRERKVWSHKCLSYCNDVATSKKKQKTECSSYLWLFFFKGKQHKQETVSVREASDLFSLISSRSSSTDKAEPQIYCLVLSSFSSSMSLREALTLLETSFPWEKRRWRSLKVRLSGASLGIEFSCSWLRHTQCRLKLYIHIVTTVNSYTTLTQFSILYVRLISFQNI